MSMYGNDEKDDLFNEMRKFLEKYNIAVLLQIVTDAVEYVEADWNELCISKESFSWLS